MIDDYEHAYSIHTQNLTNEKNIQIQIIIMKNLVQFKMKREKQTKRK